jgi:glutaredoxin
MLKLYQLEACPYCLRVRNKLSELDIAYTKIDVPREKDKRLELFEVSRQYGVPTLVDGKVVIADDDDKIIDYLLTLKS